MKAGVFGENPYKVEESKTMETVGPTADPSLNERSNATLNSQMNAVQNNRVSGIEEAYNSSIIFYLYIYNFFSAFSETGRSIKYILVIECGPKNKIHISTKLPR